MSYDFPSASYDHWKTTQPEWRMPSWMLPRDEEFAQWDQRRVFEWRSHGGDEELYELMCEEYDELERLESHARDPEDDDFE